MRRLLHPFVLVVSAILRAGYAYITARLTSTAPVRMALAAPFVLGPGARVGAGTRPELTLLRLVAAIQQP